MKKTVLATHALIPLALLVGGGHVRAHDAWIEAKGNAYVVLYGHGEKGEPYAASKVRSLSAIDAKGAALTVKRQDAAEAVQATVAPAPALMTLSFDNGYWSKTADDTSSKNLPKNEVPGAVSGVHSVKYGKTVFAWSAAVTKPQGQQLELVPLSAAAPVVGKTLPVQALWDGKPLAGVKLVWDEHGKGASVETGADGKAEVPVVKGQQAVSVNRKQDLASDPRADSESISANLVFTVR